MRRDGGITLVECLAAAMAVVVALCLLIPAYVRSGRHAHLVECQGRLHTLHKAAQNAPPGPSALGSAYWTRLAVAPETLRCPLAAGDPPRDADYLGPRQDPAGLKDSSPIGCDDESNHGPQGREGGNVLYKSGEVQTLHPLGPGAEADPWREASRSWCSR